MTKKFGFKKLIIFLCQTLFFQEILHKGINAEDILVDNIPLRESSEIMNVSLHDLFNRNLFLVTGMFDSRAKTHINETW